MIKAVPLYVLEEMNTDEAVKFLQTDTSAEYDLLNKIYDEIDAEKNTLIQIVRKFYFTKTNFTEYDPNGLSPKEIWDIIQNKMLRIRRLMLVYHPDFYESVAKHKVSGFKYERIKILWLNDSGDKFIKATRSYGKHGSRGLEYAMPKLLGTYFGDSLTDPELNVRHKNRVMLDFVAKLGGEKWAFEFKAANKKDFIETAVRLELWHIYKNT